MFVGCWWSVVDRCPSAVGNWLFVACCLMFVVCCLLFVVDHCVWCSLLAVAWLYVFAFRMYKCGRLPCVAYFFFVVCWLSVVVRCFLFVVCCRVLCVVRCLFFVARCMLCVVRCMLCVALCVLFVVCCMVFGVC